MIRYLAPKPREVDQALLWEFVPDAIAFNEVDLDHPEADLPGSGVHLAVYVPDDSAMTEDAWIRIVSQMPEKEEPEVDG